VFSKRQILDGDGLRSAPPLWSRTAARWLTLKSAVAAPVSAWLRHGQPLCERRPKKTSAQVERSFRLPSFHFNADPAGAGGRQIRRRGISLKKIFLFSRPLLKYS
jgi:hypothetical protein